MGRSLRLPRALISTSEAHDGPAVVTSGAYDVDLIAAIRPVLVLPHFAGYRMNRQSKRRSMPERINLRLGAVAAHERIVARSGAVIPKPQQFAAMILRVLWIIPTIGHEDRPITAERDPRCTRPGLWDEDISNFRECPSIPPSACERVG